MKLQMNEKSTMRFAIYYLSGFLSLPIYLIFSNDSHFGKVSTIIFVALLDLLSLGVFFFGSGRALLSMRSPYRQLAYIFLFCGGCVIATAIMIRGYNYSETIRQPYLGFAFLTGDTFVDGRMTVLGLLVSMTQALAMVSCVLVPREFFYLLLRNGK